jgi:hypothetical protein
VVPNLLSERSDLDRYFFSASRLFACSSTGRKIRYSIMEDLIIRPTKTDNLILVPNRPIISKNNSSKKSRTLGE